MVAAYPLHGICLDLFLFAVFLNTFPLLLVEMGKRERDRMKERKKERKKEERERKKPNGIYLLRILTLGCWSGSAA